MRRTRFALTEEEYTDYFVFLMGLAFYADSLVDGLRDTSSFFFASNAYCSSLWRFIRRRAESSSEGVIVNCGDAHERKRRRERKRRDMKKRTNTNTRNKN